GACSFTGGNLYRNGIRFRRSIQIVYLNEPESRAVGFRGDGKLFDHLEIAERPRLGTKPPAVADEIWQNFALELFPLAIAKQNIQLGWRFDRRHHAFLHRAATVNWRLQGEPVIGMRTQSDDIARFLDRPK